MDRQPRTQKIGHSRGTIVFAGLYLYSGAFVLAEVWETGERMLDLGTPLVVPIVFVPLGMALMLYHGLCRLLRMISAAEYAREEGIA